ncbi:hypothetical protein DENSPDRAFT_789531 [Dentipellis sp. KUC8613]|nr:hypothetical protein DENSPDRAFT_789531 [Dentipellis sp. KUC8613]
MTRKLSTTVKELTDKDNGWHFSALHATPEKLRHFQLEETTSQIRQLAPEVWDLKTTVIINIMMQANNQQCNALQSIVGVFLHSCGTPEKVIKMLARSGISISVDAINDAVKSLSVQTTKALGELGSTLLAAYAYDNFDVQLNMSTPTVDDGGSSLVHLTSGDLLQLDHGVTKDDLRCSKELWETSPYNDHATRPPYPDFIGTPEAVEQIPVTKLYHVPARAMDINESTVSGNLDAIQNLMRQGGIGNPDDDEDNNYIYDIVDMSEYVVLFHGDLSTCERVQSVMDRRADEDTAWRRFQFIIFILGLFHLKMAAAEAIWRISIAPIAARKDLNSLMAFVRVIRESETGKIGSKPKFCQMHEVIRHVGVGLRLDAWRIAAGRRNREVTSLEELAGTEPTLDTLREMALDLCDNYVAGNEANIFEARLNPDAERDQQHENILLLHQIFLLYEELTYAMNAGDIGRVETVFQPWICIFKATGKHKYAAQMTRFLTDVHFRYPEGLRKAVRYNMLVNPTGREHQFRAVDWVVELNNLFTKDHHGGSGSNRSKERIITESPLILVYRNSHANIEKNFKLAGLSFAHAEKDMTQSFRELTKYMKNHRTNEYTAGRKSAHEIPDALDEGVTAEFKVTSMEEDGLEGVDIFGDSTMEAVTGEDLGVDAPI